MLGSIDLLHQDQTAPCSFDRNSSWGAFQQEVAKESLPTLGEPVSGHLFWTCFSFEWPPSTITFINCWPDPQEWKFSITVASNRKTFSGGSSTPAQHAAIKDPRCQGFQGWSGVLAFRQGPDGNGFWPTTKKEAGVSDPGLLSQVFGFLFWFHWTWKLNVGILLRCSDKKCTY